MRERPLSFLQKLENAAVSGFFAAAKTFQREKLPLRTYLLRANFVRGGRFL